MCRLEFGFLGGWVSTINLIFPHEEGKKKFEKEKWQFCHWSQQYLGNVVLRELQM